MDLIKDDKEFINMAIDLSRKADYPYGSIIVRNGKIIGRSDSTPPVSKSAFSHAELRAIEDAIKQLGGHLCAEGGKDCTIYSSCEPCLMCMGAIIYAGIGRLVYAATLEDSAFGVNEILVSSKEIAKFCKNRKLEIVAELERENAIQVMENWRKDR